jgi:hypothetical protein
MIMRTPSPLTSEHFQPNNCQCIPLTEADWACLREVLHQRFRQVRMRALGKMSERGEGDSLCFSLIIKNFSGFLFLSIQVLLLDSFLPRVFFSHHLQPTLTSLFIFIFKALPQNTVHIHIQTRDTNVYLSRN